MRRADVLRRASDEPSTHGVRDLVDELRIRGLLELVTVFDHKRVWRQPQLFERYRAGLLGPLLQRRLDHRASIRQPAAHILGGARGPLDTRIPWQLEPILFGQDQAHQLVEVARDRASVIGDRVVEVVLLHLGERVAAVAVLPQARALRRERELDLTVDVLELVLKRWRRPFGVQVLDHQPGGHLKRRRISGLERAQDIEERIPLVLGRVHPREVFECCHVGLGHEQRRAEALGACGLNDEQEVLLDDERVDDAQRRHALEVVPAACERVNQDAMVLNSLTLAREHIRHRRAATGLELHRLQVALLVVHEPVLHGVRLAERQLLGQHALALGLPHDLENREAEDHVGRGVLEVLLPSALAVLDRVPHLIGGSLHALERIFVELLDKLLVELDVPVARDELLADRLHGLVDQPLAQVRLVHPERPSEPARQVGRHAGVRVIAQDPRVDLRPGRPDLAVGHLVRLDVGWSRAPVGDLPRHLDEIHTLRPGELDQALTIGDLARIPLGDGHATAFRPLVWRPDPPALAHLGQAPVIELHDRLTETIHNSVKALGARCWSRLSHDRLWAFALILGSVVT